MTYQTYKRSTLILLKKETHRSQWVISLHFSGRQDWLAKLKTLSDLKYSRTKVLWYIPYDVVAYNKFLDLKIPFSISSPHDGGDPPVKVSALKHDLPGISTQKGRVLANSEAESSVSNINVCTKVNVTWNSRKFVIDLPYTVQNVKDAKCLAGVWWNSKIGKWLCKADVRNLEQIQDLWHPWSEGQFQRLFTEISTIENPCKVLLYYSPKFNDRFCVKVIGYGANHHIVKSFSNRQYEKHLQVYLLPFSKATSEEVIRRYAEIGYKIENRLPSYAKVEVVKTEAKKVEFFLSKQNQDHYSCLKKMAFGMLSQNYGVKTITSYCGKLSRLMSHLGKVDMEEISSQEVKSYLEYVTAKGASFSLINIIYSAVKLYHERISLDSDFVLENIQRPNGCRTLPTFLSEPEVLRLFDQIDNIKHLAIVYLLYGSGIRKGELLNIELQHVYWERNQVLIVRGKGKKDRMVNIGFEAKDLLDVYFHRYKPQKFLFEGTRPGKQYSAGSVGNVVRKAASRARISKKVTPHVLRHSFATHLMDHGIAIPKIQKLLGHRDIKTTLIYTHVTNADASKVVSPLDTIKKRLK